MAHVICTLDNASESVNGVAFKLDRGQMISEDVTDEVAAGFAAIPGYEVAGAKKAEGKPPEGKPDAKASGPSKGKDGDGHHT